MILNNDVILILGCVAFALVLVLIGVVIAKNKEIVTCKSKMEILDAQNRELSIYNARLEAELHAQKEGNSALKSDLDEQGKKLELKLNAIMEQHLEQKLQKLDTASTKSLETLLKPFKENLDTFKKSVENSQESSIKKFAELSKEIELVARAGMNISKEAENLTKALKGKKQSQGSWGEMILESVLEYSGLIKGVHYETQESYKDEEGRTKRPDVVIKLPQERTIIIDSKVSLNSYDEFIRAESEEEKRIASKALCLAFR
nr:DNA recombination protein RmuC [Sulfurospirillum sp.]